MERIFNLQSFETFSNVSEEILHNLHNLNQISHTEVDQQVIQAAKEDFKKLILNTNYDIDAVAKLLKNKSWCEEKVSCFISLLEKKKSKILYEMFLNYNSKYGETISDFDWLLKIVMGTNDLKTLSYPLVQLILSSVDSDGQEKTRVYDFNKDMLSRVISLLENIDGLQYVLFYF